LSFISIELSLVTVPHDIYVCYSLIGLVAVFRLKSSFSDIWNWLPRKERVGSP
jgi:hypothetical protein